MRVRVFLTASGLCLHVCVYCVCVYVCVCVCVCVCECHTYTNSGNKLQHTASHCIALQHTATRCNTEDSGAVFTWCTEDRNDNPFELGGGYFCYDNFLTAFLSILQVCCSVLQCVAVCCSVLQCVAVCCRVMHCVAVCCSVLQRVAVCCCVLL